MKILHYALGFPPYRSGGLTRYVMDLMRSQCDEGHNVALLWPGCMRGQTPYIKRHKTFNGISSFELRNPLPVVLDRTVGDPDAFHYPVDGSSYINFLHEMRPDVIHIHSLQGLHKEFLDAAIEQGVPTVFTTHDFFGLYPMNQVYALDKDLSNQECSIIDANSPSLRSIKLQQSAAMRWLKSSRFARRLLMPIILRSKNTGTGPQIEASNKDIRIKDYKAFRDYEVSILDGVDCIIFNSSVSKHAYERFCRPKSSVIIPITHSNLPNRLSERVNRDNMPIHIAYLGGTRPYKGLSFLKEVIKDLANEGELRFHFDIFGVEGLSQGNVSFKPPFTDFNKAMLDEDLVIVPSLSYESFGFVVLEALCAGLPVIVSDCVGASILLNDGYGFIFHAGNVGEASRIIRNLTRDSIRAMNKEIKDSFSPVPFIDHCKQIEDIYCLLEEGGF